MRSILTSSLAVATLAFALPAFTMPASAQDHSAHNHAQGDSEARMAPHMVALGQALKAENRKEDHARDEFRHPLETLMFFGVLPDMKIGEYAPGGGWYSRVIGNYISDKGKLVGLFFDPAKTPFSAEKQQGLRDEAAGFAAKAAGWTGRDVARFNGMTLDTIPDSEKGTFDRILLFRMMHNITRWNMADSEIKAMRELLTDDGMIGIVQHRAKADAPYSYTDGNKGYMRQADIVAFMELNGFELVRESEINANPKDTADHPDGVWEMPPVLRTKREDLKDKGESDRMTLLFRKRP